MGFVTPVLLAGSLLVAIPVALHLIMRKQPQPLVFPALRFVKGKRDANRRQLKLRHLVLLALRCAAIVLLALAVARPYFKAAGADNERNPVAAVLVFDNSLRMQYVRSNRTRLAEAQDLGAWLVRQLPRESSIAVSDLRGDVPEFEIDHSGALERIERLAPVSSTVRVVDGIAAAIDCVQQKPDHRQEIYLLTDLAQSEFSDEVLERLAARLEAAPDVSLYFVDVGVDQAPNLALSDVDLVQEIVTLGGTVEVSTELRRHHNDAPTTVELVITNLGDQIVKRRQVLAAETTGEITPIHFAIPGIVEGIYQGVMSIDVDDPLAFDNQRYFTFEVQPPRRILLLADRHEDALYLSEALSPTFLPAGIESRFECHVAPFATIAETALSDYDAVVALNPGLLPNEAYRSLVDYTAVGGGLAIVLGERTKRAHWQMGAAAELLPAPLQRRSRDASHIVMRTADHPLLLGFRDVLQLAAWQRFPVYQYWQFEPLPDNAYGIVRLANGDPLIVEHQLGQGHVVTWATPVGGPGESTSADRWNLLAVSLDAEPWPFFVLATGLADYLASVRGGRLNFTAGEPAVLPLSPTERVANYVIQLPDGSSERRPLAPTQDDVIVSDTTALGNYRVLAGGERATLRRGFSVNSLSRFSELERVHPDDVTKLLGEERVRFAGSQREIDLRVGQARFGSELFGWILGLLVVVVLAEHVLANRFYRRAT